MKSKLEQRIDKELAELDVDIKTSIYDRQTMDQRVVAKGRVQTSEVIE